MRFDGSNTFAGAALALLLFFSSDAQAMSITGGGIDQALGCSSLACGSTQTLGIGTPLAPATGTLELDTGALTLSFQMNVAALPMAPLGPDDNGVYELSFINTVYHAVALSVLDLGGSYLIGPAQTASVTGIQSQMGPLVPPPSGFAALSAQVNGSCFTSGGDLSCDLSFGQTNFSFDIGTPGETRYFQHTANVVAAVPEPTTLALLGVALFSAAAVGRRS